MYAGIAGFEGADTSWLDEVLEAIREQIEAGVDSPSEGLKAARSAWMLVNRTSGRGLGITLFDSGERALPSHPPSSNVARAARIT